MAFVGPSSVIPLILILLSRRDVFLSNVVITLCPPTRTLPCAFAYLRMLRDKKRSTPQGEKAT